MKRAVSSWMRTVRARLPEPKLLLVPGEFFYTHRFEIADGMSSDEVPAFLSLALEGASPFPLEQLLWGHAHTPGERHALVFATTRNRLRALGDLDLNDFRQVFPGFISLFGEHPRRPTIRFVCQGGTLSALIFPGGSVSAPEQVVSREIEAEILSDDALLAARDRLASEVERPDYITEAGLWAGEGYTFDQKNRPIFMHRRLGTDQAADEVHRLPLSVGEQALWALDLRDEAFARQRRQERAFGRQLWTGVRMLALLFLILLFLQVTSWGLGHASGWIDRQIVARQPATDQVLNSRDLINRLARGSAQSTDPIRMLSTVNQVRPDSIFFRSASADNFNELSFDGESREGANAVNEFERQLLALDTISAVDQAVTIREGRTYFQMSVTFDGDSMALQADLFEAGNAP